MRPPWRLIAVCIAVALVGCSVDAVRFTPLGNAPGEDCNVTRDENGNALAGCDDPACVDEAACQSRCGNGILEAGESCDDGNTIDGDGCSAHCNSKEICGNGTVDLAAGEVCDDGNNQDGDGCSHDCLSDERCGNGITDRATGEACDPPAAGTCGPDCRSLVKCGNHVRDEGEECDDGAADNGPDKDCRSDCVLNRCGDGFANTHGTRNHEDCDGATPALPNVRTAVPKETATCNLDCTAPRCGDNKVNHSFVPPGAAGPEQCDNGDTANFKNADNTDCTATCQRNVCGDNLTNTLGPLHVESCDAGNPSTDPDCTSGCVDSSCGDGILQTGRGEDCDLGRGPNGNSDDGACTSMCKLARCGDGKVHTGVEECDTNDVGNVRCSSTCHLQTCGNGIIDPGEECDNGTIGSHRNSNNDDCRTDCILNRCGDGFQNTVGIHPEACDSSLTPAPPHSTAVTPVERADCNVSCTIPVCGDNIVNHHFTPNNAPGVEQCDDGGIAPNDGCSARCQFEHCGDGIVQPPEECDGAAGPGPCSPSCRTQRCNNGILDPGEQCDDGVGNNGLHKRCNASCKFNVCGDGDVLTNVEQCDDGTAIGGVPTPRDTANCDSDCTRPLCGDGHANLMANEQCDDGNSSNADDCTNACRTAICGDGFTRSNPLLPVNREDCDDPTLPTDCPYSPTQTSCNVCNASCDLVPGQPLFCGDGVVQPRDEICDGGTGAADRNCGACSADCGTVISQHATGLILATPATGGAYAAGSHFSLGDTAPPASPITFEFTTTGIVTPGRIPILIGVTDTAAQVAFKIADAFDSSTLHINTNVIGGAVILTHQRATALGNVPFTNLVVPATFVVDGMQGGQGGRCLIGNRCKVGIECASNHCNVTTGLCVDP